MNYEPKDKQPVIYLSGAFGALKMTEEEWLTRTKCRFRCYSFGYTCPDAFYYSKKIRQSYDASLKQKVGIMMDSGAFSFHKFVAKSQGTISNKKSTGGYKMDHTSVDKLKDETIELYIQYCKENSKNWDFYITFDFRKHCPQIYETTKMLEKHGLRPLPVYHGDQSIEWLERYCKEGYKFVGIGSTNQKNKWKDSRYYHDAVFNVTEKYGVKVHGLGITALALMFIFPFYSVDSATWVKVAAYGKMIFIDPNRNVIGQIHVSERDSSMKGSYNTLPASVQKTIRNQVEGYGFDFHKVRTELSERCTYNAFLFSNHVSDLKEAVANTRIQWNQLI